MSQHYDAQGKTFVITGGASGLGAAYVELFLSKGAKGIAVLDVAEEVGKTAAECLNKIYDNKVTFIKCDVSKEEDIVSAFDAVVALFKQIDVVINNAGIMNDSPHMWRTSCDVNWQGLVSFTLKSIKHMSKDKGGAGGTIINISSTAALTRFPFVPIYKGCKTAVLQFSHYISMHPFYENTNIRMLTMCFGATDTPILQNLKVKCYEPEYANSFVKAVEPIVFQKVESAIAAFIHVFENGEPGTIWLSVNNKPAKDITAVINRVSEELERVVISD